MLLKVVRSFVLSDFLLGESEFESWERVSRQACSASNFFFSLSTTSGLTRRSLLERRSTGTKAYKVSLENVQALHLGSSHAVILGCRSHLSRVSHLQTKKIKKN